MEFLNHIKELWEVPDSPSVTMLDCEGERVRFELPVIKVIALCSYFFGACVEARWPHGWCT